MGSEMCIRDRGYDPYISENLFSADEIALTDLDTLTRESDFITLHVPMLDSTRNLFDLERMQMMKPTARIINVARGGIINEDDLAIAIKDGVIAGAAVDVFVKEPIEKDHPLVNLENVLLTPHLGASTNEAKEGVSIAICEMVRDYLVNHKLSSALNLSLIHISEPTRPY